MMPNHSNSNADAETRNPNSPSTSHPKGVRLIWVIIVAFCSTIVGGLLVAYLLREPKQKSIQPQSVTREMVIPDQTLELMDGSGQSIASITAGGGSATASVLNIGGFSVLGYQDNHTSMLIGSSYKTILADEAEAERLAASQPRKSLEEMLKEAAERSKVEASQKSPKPKQPHSWSDMRGLDVIINSGLAPLHVTPFWRDGDFHFEPLLKDFADLEPQGLIARIRYKIKPSKPKRIRSVAEILSTEELRLVDREGWRFATLGLTSSGDPAIVFTDKNGGVRVAWVLRHGLIAGEPDWYDVALFDWNVLRVSAELRPGKPLDLAILDNIGTRYGLNLDANKFSLKQNGRSRFPELSGLNLEPRRPVALYDGRGLQIWKAPVVLGQPVTAPTILPSKIQVLDDASMSTRAQRIVASPKGDMRPIYRVVGRMRNDSPVEIVKVHLRISILDQSRTEVDGADIALGIDIPPGATRAFDQEIQVLPPPKWTWNCEVISATPKQ
jgi:hypothetical protein